MKGIYLNFDYHSTSSKHSPQCHYPAKPQKDHFIQWKTYMVLHNTLKKWTDHWGQRFPFACSPGFSHNCILEVAKMSATLQRELNFGASICCYSLFAATEHRKGNLVPLICRFWARKEHLVPLALAKTSSKPSDQRPRLGGNKYRMAKDQLTLSKINGQQVRTPLQQPTSQKCMHNPWISMKTCLTSMKTIDNQWKSKTNQ